MSAKKQLFTLIALTTIAANTAQAQRLIPPAPAAPVNGGIEEQVGGTPRNPDYWIVSSRSCPQSGAARCCLSYYHRSPDGWIRRSNANRFSQWVKPGVPMCVIVHGSTVTWRRANQLAAEAYQWLRSAAPHKPVQIVLFSWPSDRQYCLIPTANLGLFLPRVAARNGFYLAHFLGTLPVKSPVCIIGHSHGARLTVAALHLLAGGAVDGRKLGYQCGGRRIRAIFAAAAFDHDRLNPGDRFGRAMIATESMMNMKNDRDPVLCLYTLRKGIWLSRAMGRIGITTRDMRSLGPHAHKYKEYDVTSAIGFHHRLNHYFACPQLACRLVPWVYFTE